MADRLQIKRDQASVWSSINPILSDGEFGFERDTNLLKIGNGVLAWNSLPYIQSTAALLATSGEAIGGHRVVISSAGLLYYASSTNLAHKNRVVGMTLGAVASGENASYLKDGLIVEPSWAWDTSLPVYLADNGLLTQTPVNTTGFVMIVGMPASTTSLYISFQPPIILG